MYCTLSGLMELFILDFESHSNRYVYRYIMYSYYNTYNSFIVMEFWCIQCNDIFFLKRRKNQSGGVHKLQTWEGASINHVDGMLDIFDPPLSPLWTDMVFWPTPLENHVEFWRPPPPLTAIAIFSIFQQILAQFYVIYVIAYFLQKIKL